MDWESFRDELAHAAARLGFAGLGVVAAREFTDLAEVLRSRQAEGTYPLFCERDVTRRTRPDDWLPGCRSLWVAALPYRAPGALRREGPPSGRGPFGRIAAYALPEDYHTEMRRRLRVLARWAAYRAGCSRRHHFRVLVDTGPPVERHLWRLSGAGWIGKNTCAYAPGAGSWVVLGVIATTLPAPETRTGAEAPPQRMPPDPCMDCSRCIDACPTGALEPYRMDPNRCIAQFSQQRGDLGPSERENLHRWLFGCDICQIACPCNGPDRAPLAFGQSTPLSPVPGTADRIPLQEILSMSEAAFQAGLGRGAASWRGLAHLKRNAAYVLEAYRRRLKASAPADRPNLLRTPFRTRPSGAPSPRASATPGR
ncbi:MAG: QueG-associated DUF1730 domain-containing protein [Bacillota bacterium]